MKTTSRSERGTALTGYVIGVFWIAIFVIGGVSVFADNLRALFGAEANCLAGDEDCTPATKAAPEAKSRFGASQQALTDGLPGDEFSRATSRAAMQQAIADGLAATANTRRGDWEIPERDPEAHPLYGIKFPGYHSQQVGLLDVFTRSSAATSNLFDQLAAKQPRYAPHQSLPSGAEIGHFVISKSQRAVLVLDDDAAHGGQVLKRYDRVSFGSDGNRTGPKVYQGDNRTPEGEYTILDVRKSRNFNWFLEVSYPNSTDRRRYQDAKSKGLVPKGKGIGGDRATGPIGIHGEYTRRDWQQNKKEGLGMGVDVMKIDWTQGCIALPNEDMKGIYEAARRFNSKHPGRIRLTILP